MKPAPAAVLSVVLCLAGCVTVCPPTKRGETSANVDQLKERAGIVTQRGIPVTLLGDDVPVGAVAPDFRVADRDFKAVRLADFRGKVVLISAVPSLDTTLCSLQTKRFNDEVRNLPPNVQIVTISMDLPFAQKRFCDTEKVDRIKVLSDHVWREFGMRYGLLIKDRGLLARAVMVIGKDGKVSYREIVPDTTFHPDYDAVLKAAARAAK